MTKYKQVDVVLVEFGYSEEIGSKKRPALIISSDNYHKSRRELIAMAITSNIERMLFGDTEINKWEEAGLLYPSLVTGIIRTIKDSIVIRKLGILSEMDFKKVQTNLRNIIELY